MKVFAWTKKAFAPAFSSSAASSSSTTSFNNNNHSRLSDNASINSSMSFSTSPLNIKKRLRLFGSSDSSTTNSSSSSLMNTIFFSHMRNRNASCPDIHKTVGGNYHKIDASTYKTDSTEYDDKGSGGVATMEGEEEKPITTTIYYHPPSPRDAVTETPSTGFSVASTAIKSQHQQQQKQSLSIPSSLVESRHELWYLRHIGRIPAASTSTPELNSLPQQLPSQYRLHHDKDCKFSQWTTTQHDSTERQQRYTSLCDHRPPPLPPKHQHHQYQQQQGKSPFPSSCDGQSHLCSRSTPNNPSADTTDPILLASLPLSPAPSNVFKASSQESLCTAPPPSHIFTPMAFQTRRSSANYSKDDIIKKNKNYEKKHAQLTPHRAIPVPATPVPSRTNSSSCHPLYSVETLKRLRDSIRDMAEFAPSSSSPVPDSVMPPRTEVLPVSDNSSDIISASIASVNGAWCPHNSPIISSDIEFPTSTAVSGKTITIITGTEAIVPPVSIGQNNNGNNEHTVEQLIQMVDILAQEVKLMKQKQQEQLQQQQLNRSNCCSASTNSSNSATCSTGTTLSASRNKNASRSPSIVSLALATPVTVHPSVPTTFSTQNNASLSSPSLPSENNNNDSSNSSGSNNNNNVRTPLRTSQPISLPQQASSSHPTIRRNSGNNRTLHSINPSDNSNNARSEGKNMACLQILPPPPSERPPSLPPPLSSRGESQEEQGRESREHHQHNNNNSCNSNIYYHHSSLSSSSLPLIAPQTVALHPRHPSLNPRNHQYHNPRHSASLYSKSRPSSISSALLFPSPPTSPPFAPISTTATSQTTIIPHLTATTTGIIDTITSHSTASPIGPLTDTTTILTTHSCSIAASANSPTIKKHRKGSSLPVISFTPPTPPSTGLISSMSTSTSTSTSMETSTSIWTEPPPPTLTSSPATFTAAFPSIPSPLSCQIQVSTSTSSITSSPSSSPIPVLLPCPTPLTPPMSPDELSSTLSVEPLLQLAPRPAPTNDDFNILSHAPSSLTNSNKNSPNPPPFSYHQDNDGDVSNKPQQQVAPPTGPPKRPPRPPHLSVDMKQVLSLMDSRLGSNSGREAEYNAQASAEVINSYIRQSSSSSTTAMIFTSVSTAESA